jgi:hypothetical protein
LNNAIIDKISTEQKITFNKVIANQAKDEYKKLQDKRGNE